MRCQKLWMKYVISTKRKYILMHIICQPLPLSHNDRINIIPFQAITGCHTMSYFSAHGKKVFCLNPTILKNIGVGNLQEETCPTAAIFICSVYNVPEQKRCDAATLILFRECRSPETLPPRRDALQLHIQRAHYQSLVRRQADCRISSLPSPAVMRWTRDGENMSQKLMSLPPVPDACTEFVTCGCTIGCKFKTCGCKK